MTPYALIKVLCSMMLQIHSIDVSVLYIISLALEIHNFSEIWRIEDRRKEDNSYRRSYKHEETGINFVNPQLRMFSH